MPVSKKTTSEVSSLTPYWKSECGRAVVYVGDCRDVVSLLEHEKFHAVCTDPPYELGFMARAWDKSGVAYDQRTWAECLRVAKPGAHLLSFGGTRMWHRMACAVEYAGWEIRDTIMWVYASGFPKSMDVSKAIDKELGAKRGEPLEDRKRGSPGGRFGPYAQTEQTGGYGYKDAWTVSAPVTNAAKVWQGWGTCLKPALEPIVMARKPVPDTVAQCVMENGTGAINIDGCRIGTTGVVTHKHIQTKTSSGSGVYNFNNGDAGKVSMRGGYLEERVDGRWPTNLIHDGNDEVVDLLHDAARFYYTAKAGTDDRPHGNDATVHPTVKPLDLMQYLVRLVCARGGTVLDPFMGSGSTGCAAIAEGMRFVGIEQSQEYADIAVGRLKLALASVRIEDVPGEVNTGMVRKGDGTPPPAVDVWGAK